jgi:hypothetical protein
LNVPCGTGDYGKILKEENGTFVQQGTFKIKEDYTQERFPVKFEDKYGDPAHYTIDDWLKSCGIGSVRKVIDLRENPLFDSLGRLLPVHHQTALAENNSSSLKQCQEYSLLFHFHLKSKRQHESVAALIVVEIIPKQTELSSPPKWSPIIPSEGLWKRDVTFTPVYETNVDKMKKFLKAIPFQKLNVLGIWKNTMNCWQASNHMMFGFQKLSECDRIRSVEDCLKNMEWKNASRKNPKKPAPNKSRSWSWNWNWKFWTWYKKSRNKANETSADENFSKQPQTSEN